MEKTGDLVTKGVGKANSWGSQKSVQTFQIEAISYGFLCKYKKEGNKTVCF